MQSMMVNKGISHKDNFLEELAKTSSATLLPGMPSYLPHKWTIQASQNAMYVLLRDWKDLHKEDEVMQDNISEFFKFVLKRMQAEERKYKKEIRATHSMIRQLRTAPLLSEIFSPMRKRQTVNGLHKFFVDVFAISVINNANGSTSEFAEWFLLDYTPALYKLWSKKENEETDNTPTS